MLGVGTGSSGNIFDPKLQVWNNVTYADNYFQTRSQGDNPNGQSLRFLTERDAGRADWEVNLSSYAGFETDDDNSTLHDKTMAWYVGTANLSIDQQYGSAGAIYKRLGDLLAAGVDERMAGDKTWYTPDHTLANKNGQPIGHGDPNAVWEGIGTGWFHSVLGGGYEYRPYGDMSNRTDKAGLGDFKAYLENPNNRASVTQDNTYDYDRDPVGNRMRGDFAVPTLFNGNFDSIAPGWDTTGSTQAIAGWSFSNGNSPVNQSQLEKWSQIGVANAANYPDNFALELKTGQSITHNHFVVPDWGALRFDLYVPKINGQSQLGNGGKLKVTLETSDGNTLVVGGKKPEIDLTAAIGSATTYMNDRWRIGYGETGFETFTIDVPDVFRRKVATVSFELSGASQVYLDNIFFKSQHLLLGNPTLNGQEARANVSTNANNFLIEKPQYALSYDNSDRGPNWVSYQLNRTWLGNLRRPDDSWKPDPQLPPTLPATTTENYANLAGDEQIHRGHMATQSHRDRTRKDQQATFLTSSMLPQQADNNSDVFKSAWLNLEKYVREQLVLTDNKELYIISGGFGSRNSVLSSNHPLNQNGINYPSATWKVIVVLEPGQGVADINANTRIISVVTPNTEKPSDPVQLERWRNWENWLYSVDFIEEQTGLNLLTNIPRDLQDQLESKVDGGINAPLLAEPLDTSFSLAKDSNLPQLYPSRVFDVIAVGGDSLTKESSFMRETTLSTSQSSGSQIHLTQNSPTQIGSTQIGSTQIGSTQIGSTQIGSTQINSSQLNAPQSNTTQINPRELPLPGSVALQQLFSSHNFNLQNTTVPAWTSFLQGQTPFNLNLVIKDLPVGQLAEASITGYDSSGRPNSGTLFLDHDANGLGWFIDPTPFENSEFAIQNAESAFKATQGSAAFGRYDLLTTILHEMGHLAGIISGNPNYDRHIQTLNGSPVFIGDGFTAQLTPDRSHLDSRYYPYDLMNTHLAPGVRKLPSALDLQVRGWVDGWMGGWV